MLANKTRKNKLSANVEICETPSSKAIGLMFSTRKRVDDNSLVFIFNEAVYQHIHMLFVFYPIDILLLDGKKQVVEAATLKPFTFFNSKRKAQYVIEMEQGIINETGTKVGDSVEW
jgi:uncharacterized protein